MLYGGQIYVVLGIYLLIILFVLTMLWRVTVALEKMARHQLEIARDVKKLAHASDGEDAEEE